MPYDTLSLPALMPVFFAALAEGQPPEIPADLGTAAIEGLSDDELWNLVSSGGDVLAGLAFEDAVVIDPRRVDALIQQRIAVQYDQVLHEAYADANWQGHEQERVALQQVIAQLNRYLYLLRLQGVREERNGVVDAVGLVDSSEVTAENHGQLLEVSTKMVRLDRQNNPTPASRMWDRFTTRYVDIARAFREAGEIAARAANAAGDEESAQAWTRMGAIVEAMRASFAGCLTALGRQVPENYGGLRRTDFFGSIERPDWIPDFEVSGRRAAPSNIFDYRRSGGRFL